MCELVGESPPLEGALQFGGRPSWGQPAQFPQVNASLPPLGEPRGIPRREYGTDRRTNGKGWAGSSGAGPRSGGTGPLDAAA